MNPASPVTVLWLRRDLRLADNPALSAAVDHASARGGALLPVATWPQDGPDGPQRPGAPRPPGAAARWWLAASLTALDRDLAHRGSGLVVRRGRADEIVTSLALESGADTVVWAGGADPAERDEDESVAAALRAAALSPVVVPGVSRLFAPGEVTTGAGTPFRVFTPFWRAVGERASGHNASSAPLPGPGSLPPMPAGPPASDLDALVRTASPPWSEGFADAWEPGEAGAHARLARLLDHALATYETDRDRPDLPGTSRLSPHLHRGELTPRQIARAVGDRVERCEMGSCPPALAAPTRAAAAAFVRQLVWREFAHHVLDDEPGLATQPLDRRFTAFPWRDPVGDHDAARDLVAWQRGLTGYPLVDAGMRELWTTGWMHNRVRMVCASFLVKHLLLPWQEGEAWFWDTLLDADAANNPFGWQWVAGCGADAAPYFRIFSPMLQGDRFDPAGDYVRRWVPEVAALPTKWLHQPWRAPARELGSAGVELGETYPGPLVDHTFARGRALAGFAGLRGR